MDFTFQTEHMCNLNNQINQKAVHYFIHNISSPVYLRQIIQLTTSILRVAICDRRVWWAAMSYFCVSVWGFRNLMHKQHMSNNQSCLRSSSTRPVQPVLFITAKPCRNPELCTSLKRLIRLVILYSTREKRKRVVRVTGEINIKSLSNEAFEGATATTMIQ